MVGKGVRRIKLTDEILCSECNVKNHVKKDTNYPFYVCGNCGKIFVVNEYDKSRMSVM